MARSVACTCKLVKTKIISPIHSTKKESINCYIFFFFCHSKVFHAKCFWHVKLEKFYVAVISGI
jgi:hypothetical protein